MQQQQQAAAALAAQQQQRTASGQQPQLQQQQSLQQPGQLQQQGQVTSPVQQAAVAGQQRQAQQYAAAQQQAAQQQMMVGAVNCGGRGLTDNCTWHVPFADTHTLRVSRKPAVQELISRNLPRRMVIHCLMCCHLSCRFLSPLQAQRAKAGFPMQGGAGMPGMGMTPAALAAAQMAAAQSGQLAKANSGQLQQQLAVPGSMAMPAVSAPATGAQGETDTPVWLA
jgi:hypothetical protein